MITVPITILDNFLNNPNDIREWALTLNYTQAERGNYPGKRTECLSRIHPEYYKYINNLILNLFFPLETPTEWTATTQFHLTQNLEKTGWIHQDNNTQITALIYLSKDDPMVNRGTSLYNLKPGIIHPYNSQEESKLYMNMAQHYLTGKITDEVYKKRTQWEEKTFNKTLDIKDKFNRLLAFDPSVFHTNNEVNTPELNERLTLITFISNIKNPFSFPIPRSKQTPMM